VDPAVGLVLEKKVGDPVAPGDRLCTVQVNNEARLDLALGMICDAFTIGERPSTVESLIVERF
jgi:thymidine phosphorylase